MNPTEESYQKICDEVWTFYQASLTKDKWRRHNRRVLLPPPPRDRPVELLFIGISPSQVAGIGYATERPGAERLAREFEYVSESGKGRVGFSNDSYYQPLLELARRVDEGFGVWPQIARGERSLLVEFTDALHITTDHRIAADLLALINPQDETCPGCLKCKEILQAELRLYRPRVVVCNGRLPSKFLWEICTGRSVERPVKESFLGETRFGCKVHFSGYLNSKWMDGFSKARLLREIAQQTQFGASPAKG
jgi:hypothetical protein